MRHCTASRSSSSISAERRPRSRSSMARRAELPVDTGWVGWLTLIGRRRRFRAWIFTAVRSRYRFVYPTFDETTARAIEACEAAWAFFGGVFKVLIPDNTSAIIATADPLMPRITPAFLEYAQTCGFHIDPARVRRPRDKGRVERAVATVRDDCFAGGAQIRSGSRRALIFVQQSAETVAAFHCHRSRARPVVNRRSAVRRREVEAAVRSIAVVTINEHRERAFEVTSVHHQQPVQTFGPDGANEPFRDPIRLRDLNRRANDSGALGLKHRIEAVGEFAIVIVNQETNRVRALSDRPRDLPRLLRHPLPVGL